MKNLIKAVMAVVVLAGIAGAAETKWNVDVFKGKAPDSKVQTGLRPCEKAGDKALIQCEGRNLKKNYQDSDPIAAPYYTVNICRDAKGALTMEVWPFMYFSDHANGDMRTMARAAELSSYNGQPMWEATHSTGATAFSLLLPRNGDSLVNGYFYDGGAPYGGPTAEGKIRCLVNK